LKKRTKKLLHFGLGIAGRSETNAHKSFASFLQKRSSFFFASLVCGGAPGRFRALAPLRGRWGVLGARHIQEQPMSESQPAPQGQQLPPLVVNVQYIKDLSFEVPNAPDIYASLRSQPAVQINLDVQARAIQEGQPLYEVVLSVKAEAREPVTAPNGNGNGANPAEGRVVFIAELHYGGVFTLNGVPPEAVEPLLLIECPRLLFPFARNVLSDGAAAAHRFCRAVAGAAGAGGAADS
jgi:preprotein translocase subunit SecB